MHRFIAFVMLISATAAQMMDLTVPTNISTVTTSTSVIITFNEVEGATGYEISIENITEQVVPEARIIIGGLQPRTTYTVVLRAIAGAEGNRSAEVETTFTTMIEGVQNLRSAEATVTSITITWNALEGATSYNIMYQADSDEAEKMSDTTAETSITFSDLDSATFYTFYVRASTIEGEGDSSMLRARTDGERVIVNGVWIGANGVFGGQITILRNLIIPRGPFALQVSVPCSISSINVWDANVDESLSDQESGLIVATQTSPWQRSKTEIGINFGFGGENCSFGISVPEVLYGIALPSTIVESTTNVPVIVNEWLNEAQFEVFTAGVVHVKLDELFSDTNNEEEGSAETETKPAIYQFVIALLPGDECPGGVAVRNLWSMSLKNVDGIAGTLPGVQYFVQEGNDWFSNNAGLIYGYDPSICSSRLNLSAEIMTGGPIVQAIVDAPNADMGI